MSRRRKKRISGLATELIRRQSNQMGSDVPRLVRWWRDSRYYHGLGSVPTEELLAEIARQRVENGPRSTAA